MKNFFNAIGVADMEKVHSAVIGWILSDKCYAFGIKEKSELLCKLFQISPNREFNKIDVWVEVYNIDILIETEDKNGTKEIWVIENKVKSNQHSNQLDKYVKIINGIEKTKVCTKYCSIPDTNQHYCFLTLVPELPEGSYSKKWRNLLYCDFYNILKDALNSMNNHVHSEIIKEYSSCIYEMTDVLKDFLTTPSNYPHVFSDGSKKKVEKDYGDIIKDLGQYASYIAECGLETIFQKCLLGEIWKKSSKGINFPFIKWEIDDSRGNAKLTITLEDTPVYISGIEFQNGSFKFQLQDTKSTSKANLNCWINILSSAKDQNQGTFKWRVNRPKTANSSYLSISHSENEWWKMGVGDFNNHLEQCHKIGDEIIKEARNRGIIP